MLASRTPEGFYELFFESLSEEVSDAARITDGTPGAKDFRHAVRESTRNDSKLILFLDEFEALSENENFDSSFVSFLRVFANQYDFGYIISSCKPLDELCRGQKLPSSPFFNIFEKVDLGSFREEEALEFLSKTSKAAGIPLESFRNEILDMAGLFPFFIQRACSTFFYHIQGNVSQSRPDLEKIKSSFFNQMKGFFAYSWENLDQEEQDVLLQLSYKGDSGESEIIERLRKKGYILDKEGKPRIFSSVFEEFIRHDVTTHLIRPQSVQDAMREAGYEIIREIKTGGTCVVYEAIQQCFGRTVALKILRPEYAGDSALTERLKREGQKVGQLSHTNIAQVHDAGETGGYYYLATEYIDGKSAYEKLQETGKFEESEALAIALAVADAMDYAQGRIRDLIHRDIKPSNIMISKEGQIKLIDFGLAKSPEDDTLTRTGHICGSFPYMSPEQIGGEKDLDASADIYSLGASLYQLLTGDFPPGLSPTIDPQVTGISKEVSEIIAKMMARNKTERYQSSAELRKDLEAVLIRLSNIKVVDDIDAVDEDGYSLVKMLTHVTMIDMTHSLNEKARYHPYFMFHKPGPRVAWFGKETAIPPAGVEFELIDHARINVWGFNEHIIRMGEHTGTHVDAPYHFLDEGGTINGFLPEQLIGPAVVVDIVQKARERNDYLLSPEDILTWEEKHGKIPEKSIILMYSDWGKRWEETREFFNKDWKRFMHFPCFSEDSAELLVQEYDILGVGTECVSIDTGPIDHSAHKVFLSANKFIIENITNLDKLPPKGAYLIVAPLKIEGGAGGPGRIFALAPTELLSKP